MGCRCLVLGSPACRSITELADLGRGVRRRDGGMLCAVALNSTKFGSRPVPFPPYQYPVHQCTCVPSNTVLHWGPFAPSHPGGEDPGNAE